MPSGLCCYYLFLWMVKPQRQPSHLPSLFTLVISIGDTWYAHFSTLDTRLILACHLIVFTITHLIVTDVFPPKKHALAGAVFNTVSQLGTSLGLAIMAIISSSVVEASNEPVKTAPDILMQGYRAVFWTCFALMLVTCIVAGLGFRKLGRLGLSKP